MIVDNAVYVAGRRTADPPSLDETFEVMRARNGFAWIGMYRPNPEELQSVADEFALPPLAVEDALQGHQRAKIEKYGGSTFLALRPARYLDADERVEFGELDIFLGADYLITVRHAESPDLALVRKRLEGDPDLLAKGPLAVLYAVLDQVVDEYLPVINGLENDIDEIEDQLFNGDQEVSRRIYQLSREVLAFQRATHPLSDMLESVRDSLAESGADETLRDNLRDVHDHVLRIVERADSFRQLLQNALMVHTTLVGQDQNNEIKKISSWAAILFTPTLVGTIYGMNFEYMPELHWVLGYPFALALMLGLGFALYKIFKRRGWL
ncbi:magnesium/cobalt transporter CorA [Herbiconiux sp. CPCC 205763]|uniref:Magnesium transport protein CorA n=1 Tax=Herbiconiux aconitum TaxID=2970913 RepID=A0ABT2GLE9_9MICO|nr:magnesium/cobalt transporter CorA [Herbiconiux aconitum]MCS5716993.1 magnesium/cobalt transporter CorA [Herbiconiux aconitum]